VPLSGRALPAYTSRDGLVNNRIRALAEDRDGNLWIGTDGGGLARLHDGLLSAFTVRDGLSHGTVHSIFEDGRAASGSARATA
jgi:ligand-binding sensor domain-containing protein